MEKRQVVLSQRKIPLFQPYFKGESAKRNNGLLNQQVFLYKHFETRFALKRGEVCLARFPLEFGSELHGDHFVVVLLDSGILNPLVTVVPLKSEKEKSLNPASDLRIGNIIGINGGKRSVAIINQIRSIDKRRLISETSINILHGRFREKTIQENTEFALDTINIYRLTDEQFNLMRKTVVGYIINNYVRHDEELLVDF